MFECCFLERSGGATARPWAVMASFAGQLGLAAIAVLLPLVYTEVLPGGRVLPVFLAPGPPPGRQRPAAAPKAERRQAVAGEAAWRGFVEPRAIPKQVAMIIEEPVAPLPDPSDGGFGVAGSIGEPSASLHAAVHNLLRVVPVEPAAPSPPAPPPAPPATKRIKVGGVVQAARAIHKPLPVYPPLARQARVGGVVRIAAVLGADGTVQDLRLIGGHPLLVPAAIQAVRQWRFQPTLLNGEPVEVETQFEVVFTLD